MVLTLPQSTVLRSSQKDTIRAAYLYYYATETAFAENKKVVGNVPDAALQARLQQLISDVLVLAKKDNFHVFNALSLLDNPLFLKEQKFEPGDGKLHFYLYNWRTDFFNNGLDKSDQLDPSNMGGVGIVML